MKKYFIFATALAALASCSSDDFVGESPNGVNSQEKGAITFTSSSKAVTRAEIDGATAAGLLNNQFVFAGTKGTSPTAFVFDQYVAKFKENTAHTTESNSNNWEYVSYTPASTSSLGEGAEQSIKYWDYSTTQYDFAAYSTGTASAINTGTPSSTQVLVTAIAANDKSYSLTGSADVLKGCYVSDLVTAYNRDGVNDYGNPVQFKFRSLAAKIRLAFYETIPGYSVKEVKFYTSSSATLATDGTESDPTLFTSSAVLPSGEGTMNITFPTTGWTNKSATDYNKAHVAFTKKSDADLSSTLVLEDLANLAGAEKKEAAGNYYLGRSSNAATYAGGLVSSAGKYYTILPYEDGANLQLRIKYTLVSTDNSGELITVDNATAVIPAELAKWYPNYAYTYIFKLSDMTNGSTGVDGDGNTVYGLTPVTLDAVVVNSEDGVQETITTVSTPSITTYSKGEVVTTKDEYEAGRLIYIVVNNGTSNVALTVGTNANLYTVTTTNAIQTITESSVENALKNGTKDDDSSPTTWTVTDIENGTLIVTKSNLLTASSQIEAADSPTGSIITVTGAKFTPVAGTTYVFEYSKAEAYVAATGTYVDGTTYYTDNTGAAVVDVTGFEAGVTDVSTYFVKTPEEKAYKVIKVASGS